MTEVDDRQALERALRTTHRSVLGLLVCCAIAIVVHGFSGEEPPPDRTFATAGILLGVAAIVLRRLGSSPVAAVRTVVFFHLGALVCSAGLGLLGALITFRTGAPETGLLFTLAGAIFALRRPVIPGSGS